LHLLAPFAISWWSPSTSHHCHCSKRSWDLWKCTFAFHLFVTFTNPLCMFEINLSKRYSIWKALALFSFVFSGRSQVSICTVWLSLTSDSSEIKLHFTGSSTIRKDCIVPSKFWKDPVLWLVASKNKKNKLLLYMEKGLAIGAFQIFDLLTYWPWESQTWKALIAKPSPIRIVMCPISVVEHQNLSSLCIHMPNRFSHLLKSCSIHLNSFHPMWL